MQACQYDVGKKTKKNIFFLLILTKNIPSWVISIFTAN